MIALNKTTNLVLKLSEYLNVWKKKLKLGGDLCETIRIWDIYGKRRTNSKVKDMELFKV